MTNKELIKQFFRGRCKGGEKSRGLTIDTRVTTAFVTFENHRKIMRRKISTNLYSKTSSFPLAVTGPKANFIISTLFTGAHGKRYETHNMLVIVIAKQMGIRFVLSPHADKAHFHAYMKEEINTDLTRLANDLKTNTYKSVVRSTKSDPLKPIFGSASTAEPCFAVPENYQNLMDDIHTLHNGEIQLKLPKNRVALLDTDEVQSLWRWLIKDNPNKEDRELLRKTYTLSRLLASKQKDVFSERL